MWPAASSWTRLTAELRVDTRQKLVWNKRLGYEIVGPSIETCAFGRGIRLTTQEEYRNILEARIGAELAAHRQSVLANQRNVQKHDVRWRRFGERVQVVRVTDGLELEAAACQSVLQGARHARLVIDQQHTRHPAIIAAPTFPESGYG